MGRHGSTELAEVKACPYQDAENIKKMSGQAITENGNALQGGGILSLVKPLIIFAVSLAIMFLVFTDRTMQDGPIIWFQSVIASASALVLKLFSGNASSDGILLTYNHFTVMVVNGCDGIFVTMMLWAAILAYPAKAGLKMIAIPLVAGTLFLLNIIRCASLVYIGSIDHHLFNVFHLYIWQAVVIVAAISIFAGYLHFSTRYSRLPG